MYRGTNPTINFTFEYDLEELNITEMYITFSQNKNVVLEKELSDVTISEYVASVELSQSDTLSMRSDRAVYIQIRLKVDGTAYATNIIETNINAILKDGEI